jgi:glycerol-3-phosphate dehydrogenase
MNSRHTAIEFLRSKSSVSVLIIGGGINGAGVFRDLALQGIDVLLVDKADFSSGTSAATSHMAHGGLRYLENGDFSLVREAIRERNLLIENAPHYVHPLPTTIPIFKWYSGLLNAPLKFLGLINKTVERGAFLIKIGLSLYDSFTRSTETVPRHSFMSKSESLSQFPLLNPNVICTATYYDASILAPERICIELICDALEMGNHAQAANYVSAFGTSGEAVTLRDELTGETYTVKPKLVVNASGPWMDQVNRSLKQDTALVSGSKGSHIVIDNQQIRTAIGDHEFFFENDDGRIVLICPIADKILVGTSELVCDDPNHVCCTPEEIDYFIAMIMKMFPQANVSKDQIVFSFSGVRPLVFSKSSDRGNVSRDHRVFLLTPGNGIDYPIYTLAGGKWTTFRSLAEKVTDQTLHALGRIRQYSTSNLSIGGGKDYPKNIEEEKLFLECIILETGFDSNRVKELFDRYGSRAAHVASFICREIGDNDYCLNNHVGYSRGEIVFLTRCEYVFRLEDLILRRTLLAILGDISVGLIVELSYVIGDELGWSESTREEEIDNVISVLSHKHGVKLS